VGDADARLHLELLDQQAVAIVLAPIVMAADRAGTVLARRRPGDARPTILEMKW
jgi:hypothetical protein